MQLPPELQVSSTGQPAPVPQWHSPPAVPSTQVSFRGQPLLSMTPEEPSPPSVSLTGLPGVPLHIAGLQAPAVQRSVAAHAVPQPPQFL
jgi:hypothetical protein